MFSETSPGPKQTLIDRVFFDADDHGDLGSGEAVPGRHPENLPIALAERVECLLDQACLAFDRVAADRYLGYQPSGETVPSTSTSVLIANHPVGDRQEPGPDPLVGRHLVESSPGDGEHLGGGIFAIGRAETADAISGNREVVGVEEGVESIPGFRMKFDRTLSWHFAMLCVRD